MSPAKFQVKSQGLVAIMTLNSFEVPPATHPMYVDEFKIINKFAKQEGNLLELKREWTLD